VLVPQFLLLDDSYTDVQAFIAMVKRIGLVNTVRPVGSVAEAQLVLGSDGRLPVVVFAGGTLRDGDGEALAAWMEEQDAPVSGIPVVMLQKPLDMYDVIASLKALSLPERAKIDTTTLSVRVELWPHGTILGEA
jgi:hypothetical protein